jgi:hypothetical protein
VSAGAGDATPRSWLGGAARLANGAGRVEDCSREAALRSGDSGREPTKTDRRVRETTYKPTGQGRGIDVLGPVEGFTPGEFSQVHLDIFLPGALFPEPRARLEAYLREAYLPYSLRRVGERLVLDLSAKALKKKILFAGYVEEKETGLVASLDVGPRFDLAGLVATFGDRNLIRQAQVRALNVQW